MEERERRAEASCAVFARVNLPVPELKNSALRNSLFAIFSSDRHSNLLYSVSAPHGQLSTTPALRNHCQRARTAGGKLTTLFESRSTSSASLCSKYCDGQMRHILPAEYLAVGKASTSFDHLSQKPDLSFLVMECIIDCQDPAHFISCRSSAGKAPSAFIRGPYAACLQDAHPQGRRDFRFRAIRTGGSRCLETKREGDGRFGVDRGPSNASWLACEICDVLLANRMMVFQKMM